MFSITAWNNEKSSVWTLSSLRSGLKKSLCGKCLSTPRFPQERRGAALGRTLCTQPLPLCACWVLMPRALGPPCGVLSFTSVSSVQSLSRVRLFATPWTAARQASLSISNSWSFLTGVSQPMSLTHILCTSVSLNTRKANFHCVSKANIFYLVLR